MLLQLGINWDKLLQDIITYGIQGVIAILIIVVAWAIGSVVGSAVNRLIERSGLEKAFDKTDVGKAFRSAGIDLSNLVGMLVTAFIVVIGIVVALQYLQIGGEAGMLVAQVAKYLPRLIGGVILLTAGLILVALLTDYIGKLLTGLFPKQFVEIGEMLRNLLLIGLIALVVSIALDLMLFTGPLVYPLILGTVIIGAGIFIGHTIVRNIVEDHPEFASRRAVCQVPAVYDIPDGWARRDICQLPQHRSCGAERGVGRRHCSGHPPGACHLHLGETDGQGGKGVGFFLPKSRNLYIVLYTGRYAHRG
jgi:hypothetical protein